MLREQAQTATELLYHSPSSQRALKSFSGLPNSARTYSNMPLRNAWVYTRFGSAAFPLDTTKPSALNRPPVIPPLSVGLRSRASRSIASRSMRGAPSSATYGMM